MDLNKALMKEKEMIEKTIAIGSKVLYLTRRQCAGLGPDTEKTLELIKETLIQHGNKDYEMPAKIGIHPHEDVFYHAMPAYLPFQKACGMKWIECYPRNPKEYKLPQTSGLLILNEVLTGCPVAIMDATWLTAMRTPAVTAVAAAALHPDAETFGMFGCGVQGIGHVEYAAKTLKKLKKIYVYDIHEDAMDHLLEAVKGKVEVEVVKGTSFEQVTKSCEVLSSATLITKENISAVKEEWIQKGQTILPCDLNTFWEASIQRNADKYIVDSIDEHELFNGMGYFPEGMPEITCETGELVAGKAKGREFKDEIIVCSNIGMSVCDMAMAKFIFDRALETNTGLLLDL